MITIARVDERLIHGQVAYAWTMAYPSDAVMAIDKEAANDQIQKSLLEFACPKKMKCFVVDEDSAVQTLKKHTDKRFFIVTKHPKTLLYLIDNGIDIKSVNIGGLYYKEGRKEFTKTIYLDQEDKNVLLELDKKGIVLDGRTTATDKNIDLAKMIKEDI